MGKRLVFSPLHICDFMQNVDNIVGPTTNEPIDLNACGVRKQAFISCEDVTRTKDNLAFMTKLYSS
jgi:hypothetical protein